MTRTEKLESLKNLAKSMKANQAIYVGKEVSFFKSTLYPILGKQHPDVEFNSEIIYEDIRSALYDQVASNPSAFLKTISYPYILTLWSIQELIKNPHKLDEIFFKHGNFFDIELLDSNGRLGIGFEVPINILAEAITQRDNKDYPESSYRIRDVLIAIVNSYDPKSRKFSDWRLYHEKVSASREGTKKVYLESLKSIFSPRSIGLACKIDDESAIELTRIRDKKSKMNKAVWSKLYKSAIIVSLNELKVTVPADSSVLNLCNTKSLISWFLVRTSVFGLSTFLDKITNKILIGFKGYKTRFSLTHNEIRNALVESVNSNISGIPMEGYFSSWRSLYGRIPGANIEMSKKTSDVVLLSTYHLAFSGFQYRPKGMKKGTIYEFNSAAIDHFILYKKMGISESAIRSLLQSIYMTNKHVVNSGILHDNYYLSDSLFNLMSKELLDFTPEVSQRLNSFIKMVTTHFANENTDNLHKFIWKLSDSGQKIIPLLNSVDQGDIKSLNKLQSKLSGVNKELLMKSLDTLSKSGIVVDSNSQKYINSLAISGSALTEHSKVLSKKFNSADSFPSYITQDPDSGLIVELLPYYHLLGSIGVMVPGVCIDYLGSHHINQMKSDCFNLIIRDDENIFLWGLVVKTNQEDLYFLNNLQGSLPSRYSKHKLSLIGSIRMTLSKIGNVAIKDQYFNSVSITDGLEKHDLEFKTRKIRLDVDLKNGLVKEKMAIVKKSKTQRLN